MIGIELKQKATPVLQALLEDGIIALPAGPTVIRLLPPLTIDAQEIDQVISALRKSSLSRGDHRAELSSFEFRDLISNMCGLLKLQIPRMRIHSVFELYDRPLKVLGR